MRRFSISHFGGNRVFRGRGAFWGWLPLEERSWSKRGNFATLRAGWRGIAVAFLARIDDGAPGFGVLRGLALAPYPYFVS